MSTLLFSAAAGALALVTGMAALAQDLPEGHNAPPIALQAPGYARSSRPMARAAVPEMVASGFAAMDANDDGAVTRAEYDGFRQTQRAARMARRGRGGPPLPPPGDAGDGAPPPPPGGAMPGGGMGGRGLGPMLGGRAWFETADANGDGRVTLAEAQAAGLAAFDRMDADHDGTVTPDERRAAMMAERGGRGGPQ